MVVVVVAFSSLAKILGECSTTESPSALFFFFEVEISSRTLVILFMPGSVHSGLAKSGIRYSHQTQDTVRL